MTRPIALAVAVAILALGAPAVWRLPTRELAVAQTPGATGPARRPDVVYQPMPESLVHALLNLAQVTSRDVVYDLGSGDGRIPIAAAQGFGARGVGIEIEFNLVRRSNDARDRAGLGDRVRFINDDLFTADISAATVVTLFLNPGVNQRLRPKLQRELRRGSRVVSLAFDMGEAWPPDLSQEVDGQTVYLWTIR